MQTRTISLAGLIALAFMLPVAAAADTPLRVIVFGAHPDDCELRAAGVAAMWVAKGAKVKFVSVTNGDIGHWREAGGSLAQRRKAEVEAAARVLGIETQVLDIHDGELEPTLENRRTITRLIRQWKADLVLCHPPTDYHPDHRNVAVLVQDSAFMVAVPFFCPDEPPLKQNPVFMYTPIYAKIAHAFNPDIVVGIDATAGLKAKALACLESQFYEGGALGNANLIPSDPARQSERRQQVAQTLRDRDTNLANRYRDKLIELYGPDRGKQIQAAEAFQLCPFGRQPTKDELLKMFPMTHEPERKP